MSHHVWRYPTFALTDHALEFITAKHPFFIIKTQYFSKTSSNKIFLIIKCKGIQKNGQIEKCPFLYNGNWGDIELVQHQLFHESPKEKNSFWLGFDTSLSFGKFSGRDGK